jgi:ankyrin repeat protein
LIWYAFEQRLGSLVRTMLKVFPNPDLPNGGNSETMLCRAVQSKWYDMVLLLLDAGANVNVMDAAGWPLIAIACRHQMIDVVKEIWKLAPSNTSATAGVIDPMRHHRFTTLHAAACLAFKEFYDHGVSLLKSTSASTFKSMINAVDDSGLTPLMQAIRYHHVEHIVQLIYWGVDVNYKNQHGETALHVALAENSLLMVRILMDHGADVWLLQKANDIYLNRSLWSNFTVDNLQDFMNSIAHQLEQSLH